MTVTIMPNFTRPNVFEITASLCKIMADSGVMYNIFCDSADADKYDFVKYISDDADLKNTDIIIAVGGDGTMMRAAKKAILYDIPILGVNAGNLAYLMGIESNEIHLIEQLFSGNYYFEEQLVIQIDAYNDKNEKVYSDICVNDAVFARGGIIKLARLDFYCDGRFINRYSADGLIVATPTGSTAYNLAAGGPIVDTRVESIILSPICPHSLSERTIIFSGNSVLKITNPDASMCDILLSCDGNDSIDFGRGYSAVIKKSDKKVKFIRIKDDTFLDILHKKMKNQ